MTLAGDARPAQLGLNYRLALFNTHETSFREKIVFNHQLTDLPVELVHLSLDLFTGFVALVEKLGRTFEQLPLPGGYYVGVDLE
jgi:hypothetical protein